MITGTHILIYTTNPEADRAFFRDVLDFRAVDVGRGWLIFAMPPAEAAFHPSNGDSPQKHAGRDLLRAHVYLMCDNLRDTVKDLNAKQVRCTEISEEAWGIKTTIALPSGGEIGLYQPTHPVAIDAR
jgi:catechol 2,3-dioxygenase-like lactoylglutathione lyase family enzyme